MAMKEETYIIYNQTEIPRIGMGVRRIYVKESRKYAYIRDKEDRRIRMKLPVWLGYKKDRFKITEDCAKGVHEGCKCVTSYGSNIC